MQYVLELRELHHRYHHIQTQYGTPDTLDGLLKTTLFPYQKEGVLFVAKAGRCLIADEMGLGKTIQALGATELMAREWGIDRVLIICPTSLKYQWKSEIEKFTDRSVQIIEGNYVRRQQQYGQPAFFQIISYGYVLRDLDRIASFQSDLVILDEAQRIKNWKTKTAQSVKRIKSDYAIVLTGTPLENRLDELHSLIQFIDQFKLGPLYKFLHNHQQVDEGGKIIGYVHLDHIGQTLNDIMIRRFKKDVLRQLPEKTTQYFLVDITPQQRKMHDDEAYTVSMLVSKWRRHGFLSEMDRQRLFLALNCMRMVCDSLYILDQTIEKSPKLDELMILLEEILESPDNKVVIFSQWEHMLRLLSFRLDAKATEYRFLHGSIPSKKRGGLIEDFQNDHAVKIFLSTDAGGVGLNLQNASIVINLDLPWNPAVLEQRIARVHRMGQRKTVQVINFVTENTIEHQMLKTLSFKQSIADGIFGQGDADIFMNDSKFNDLMKTVETMSSEIHTERSTESQEQVASTTEEDFLLSQDIPESVATECSKNVTSDPVKAPVQDPIQNLLKQGIQLWESVQAQFSDPSNPKPLASLINTLVEKDTQSGQPFLKIPMPNVKVIEQATEALETLLGLLKR